jgi:hypothetical protein
MRSRGLSAPAVATKYQLGLAFHEGSLITPPSAATPQGTWEFAMKSAFSEKSCRRCAESLLDITYEQLSLERRDCR